MELNCIVCNGNIPNQFGNQNDSKQNINISSLFRNIWTCFSELFNLEKEQWSDIFNFYMEVNEIPFCANCGNLLAQLSLLSQQLESIQMKMVKLSTIVTQAIIETSSSTSCLVNCHSSQDPIETSVVLEIKNQNIPFEDVTALKVMSRIACLRNSIFQNFNPHIVLQASSKPIKSKHFNCKNVSPSAQPDLPVQKQIIQKEQLIYNECSQKESIQEELSQSQPNQELELNEQQPEPQPQQSNDESDLQESSLLPTEIVIKQEHCAVHNYYNESENIENENEQEDSNLTLTLNYDMQTVKRELIQGIVNEDQDQDDEIYEQSIPIGLPVVSDDEFDQDNVDVDDEFCVQNNYNHVIPDLTMDIQAPDFSLTHFPSTTIASPSPSPKHEPQFVISKKIVKCDLCNGKRFATNFNLMRHMRTIHKKTILGKKKVWKQSTIPGLWRHEQEQNKFEYGGWMFQKVDNVFICTCGTQQNFMASMRCHIRVTHLGPQNPAPVSTAAEGGKCKHLGDGVYAYKNVWKFTKLGGQFQCQTCLVSLTQRKSIIQHIKTVHTPDMCRFYCKGCNLGFIARTSFLKHQKRHERQRWWRVGTGSYVYDKKFEFDCVDNGFQCGTCGFQAERFWNITQHIRDAHSTPDKCVCAQCGQKFASQRCLIKHFPNCIKKDFCLADNGKRVLYRDQWLIDIIDHSDPNTKDDARFRFRCTTCGQRRKDRGSMFRHIREKHISGPKYSCTKCGKSFDSAYHMKKHIRAKHTVRQPYECYFPGCDKKFKVKRYLILHQEKHKESVSSP